MPRHDMWSLAPREPFLSSAALADMKFTLESTGKIGSTARMGSHELMFD